MPGGLRPDKGKAFAGQSSKGGLPGGGTAEAERGHGREDSVFVEAQRSKVQELRRGGELWVSEKQTSPDHEGIVSGSGGTPLNSHR